MRAVFSQPRQGRKIVAHGVRVCAKTRRFCHSEETSATRNLAMRTLARFRSAQNDNSEILRSAQNDSGEILHKACGMTIRKC